MTWSDWGTLIGGVGLFLLGMRMMTEGLKLAAGSALKDILAHWTNTPARGVLSGIFITAVVQSSSAVTVAIIGFVNAGLLTLTQAVGVIYGSNVGTTMTGWLVSLVGFHLNIQLLALPAIGVGMFMKLGLSKKRSGALGEALVGFGLFFLAIDFLKTAMGQMSVSITPEMFGDVGFQQLLMSLGAGFLLTLFMQSSSAALALIITAAGQQVLPLTAAAAMVVGANLGTTSTAALAVIGATPNAKRVAGAHIAFNLFTGVVALMVLPLMLWSVELLVKWIDLTPDAPTLLASFHTSFNLLGVILLWPFTRRLVASLENRFRKKEEDLERLEFLDSNIAASAPDLAYRALGLELNRVFGMASKVAQGCFADWKEGVDYRRYIEIVESLLKKIDRFTNIIRGGVLSDDLSVHLPAAVFSSRYLLEVCDSAKRYQHFDSREKIPESLQAELKRFDDLALSLMLPEVKSLATTMELTAMRDRVKQKILDAGARGEVPVHRVVVLLEGMSAKLEMMLKLAKASEQLYQVSPENGTTYAVKQENQSL